ncbi:MAG: hypothetical protein CMN73_13860 [Sphingomonas sp.]|nr:hypothetical protein [Sphingomonas sp.]|tara:strand:- start:760 stop:1074 length:315 start_codon:yes stop_codon:yes gene_type:complete
MQPGDPILTKTEWMAVAVALHDVSNCGCGSASDRTGVARRLVAPLQRWLGAGPALPLADPRLEAVRRFICASSTTGQASPEETERLEQFGFNAAQIQALSLLVH